MHLTLFFAMATLLVILSPAGNAAYAKSGNGSCKRPTPVESFSASLYTALTVSTGPEIANSLEIEGIVGALKYYKILRNDLKRFDVCNGEKVAYTVTSGIATVEKLKLLDYFNKKSTAFGNVLYRNGVLECKNSVSMSLNLFAHIRKALEGLDPSKFESYFKGLAHGIHLFYVDLGLNLQVVTQQTAEEFRNEFSDKCIQTTATN